MRTQATFLKITRLLVLGLCGLSLRAAPPASLENFIYNESSVQGSIRYLNEVTLELTSATDYHSLLWCDGTTVSESLFGYLAPSAGQYTYTQVSGSDYRLVITDASSSKQWTLSLHYETDTSGKVTRSDGSSPAFGGSFYIRPRPDDERRSLLNVSTRVVARAGAPAIIGFVVAGTIGEKRAVLIRCVGPGLVAFGVNDAWQTPTFQISRTRLYGAPNDLLSLRKGTWSSTAAATATITQATTRVGAFPLTAGSHDLADVAHLMPGTYSIVVEPAAVTDGGTVLIEVYDL